MQNLKTFLHQIGCLILKDEESEEQKKPYPNALEQFRKLREQFYLNAEKVHSETRKYSRQVQMLGDPVMMQVARAWRRELVGKLLSIGVSANHIFSDRNIRHFANFCKEG